jgi:hypothetical protein
MSYSTLKPSIASRILTPTGASILQGVHQATFLSVAEQSHKGNTDYNLSLSYSYYASLMPLPIPAQSLGRHAIVSPNANIKLL